MTSRPSRGLDFENRPRTLQRRARFLISWRASSVDPIELKFSSIFHIRFVLQFLKKLFHSNRLSTQLLLAASITLLPSSFSFQTPPPTKNSFFQMGTVALSSSIAQETACVVCIVIKRRRASCVRESD